MALISYRCHSAFSGIFSIENAVDLLNMHKVLMQFTLVIPISNRKREFNFRRRSELLFDVNSTKENGERYYFNFLQKNGKWGFSEALVPQWLEEYESEIAKALEQFLSDPNSDQ